MKKIGKKILGIWDDIKNLNPNFKFLITLFILLSIIYYDSSLQIKLINFKHLQDIYIPNNKYLNILIPAICLMLLLNAYNMSDGINGLACIIFLSWSIYNCKISFFNKFICINNFSCAIIFIF